MSSVPYLGFRASEQLRDDSERLIENIRNQTSESQVPQVNRVLQNFIPEMLDAFLLDVCTVVELGPTSTKVVRGAAGTITKTVNMLVKQLLKKRTNEELVPIAEYMDQMMIRANEASNNLTTIACLLDDSLYQRMRDVIQEVREGDNPQAQLPVLTELMHEVTDVSLKGFFERPVNLLKMNIVVRKLANTGLDTCRSAIRMVINKVFKTLSDEQLVKLVDYFEELLITGPDKGQSEAIQTS